MKTYRFFTAILMVALSFNLVSCGDDDDNGGETGKSTKRLTKIVTTSGNEEYATIQFTYSGDKVSSIKIKTDSDDELIVSTVSTLINLPLDCDKTPTYLKEVLR